MLKRFLDSVETTTAELEKLEVVLVVDEDDKETQAVVPGKVKIKTVILPRGRRMGDLNMTAYKASSGRYVMLVNDDLVLETKGWDFEVLDVFRSYGDDIGLVHVNDELFRDKLCCFPIQSRRVCEIAGVCPDYYRRYRIDDHVYDIYSLLSHLGYKRITYLPDVIFRHLNFHEQNQIDPDQKAFRTCDGKAYVPDQGIISQDHEDYMRSFNDRKKLALKLAAIIHSESRAEKSARYSPPEKASAMENRLRSIDDPYSYKNSSLVVRRECRPANPRTTIVVVSADIASPYASKCIQRIKQHTSNYDLVIMDNNRNPEFNHPREMNRILSVTNTDYIVFLDDDVHVEAGWLEGLFKCMDERTGAVTPLHRDKSGKVSYCGIYMALDGSGAHMHDLIEPCAPRDTMSYCSAALLVDLRKCGHILMDESYKKYYFDLVHGLEVWSAGYRAVVSPYSIVTHLGGATCSYGSQLSNHLNQIDEQTFVNQWIKTGRLDDVKNGIWRDSPYISRMLDIRESTETVCADLIKAKDLSGRMDAVISDFKPYSLFSNILYNAIAKSADDMVINRQILKKFDELGIRTSFCTASAIDASRNIENMAFAAGWKNVAIYGAGKHTNKLLVLLDDDKNSFQISLIIDDSPRIELINGIPVVKPDQIGKYEIDAIVVSSDSIEPRLLNNIRGWPENRAYIMPLYNPPKSVERDFMDYNIIRYIDIYYAVHKSLGDIHLACIRAAKLAVMEKEGLLIFDEQLVNLKDRIRKISDEKIDDMVEFIKYNKWDSVCVYGAGFLGLSLCDRLVKKNVAVRCLLNDSKVSVPNSAIQILSPDELNGCKYDAIIVCAYGAEEKMIDNALKYVTRNAYVCGIVSRTMKKVAK